MNTTQLDPAMFERIVEEVIRRLLERGVSVAGAAADAEPAATLEIQDKLVTLATLRERLTGVGKVQVGSRAVVTPAVFDELRTRGIQLLRK